MMTRSIVLLISAGVLACAAYMFYNKTKKAHQVDKFSKPTNFLIYNYLPSHSISIDVSEHNSEESNDIHLVNEVKPKSTAGLTKDQVNGYLKPGSTIKIYVLLPDGKRVRYADYLIDVAKNERIKNLHVGMITTRFIGSTDGLRMSTTSGNAVSGNASLVIHNLSYIPLRLNDDVLVEPHSSDRYLGYLHQGVTLGTIFSDQDSLYPDYQYLKPYTDLYYGVVSDLRQPLYGCWQMEFTDDCEYGQTLWPFQDGIA